MAKESDFSAAELDNLKQVFAEFDKNGDGNVDAAEVKAMFKAVGEEVPGYKIRDMIAEVDVDGNGTVEWSEFLQLMKQVQAGNKRGSDFSTLVRKVDKVKKAGGTSQRSTAGTTHSFTEDEALAFIDWINYTLGEDKDLSGDGKVPGGPAFQCLPLPEDDAESLFPATKDGVLMCKLINSSQKGTIDERAINMKKKLNIHTIVENQHLVLNSAASIGCVVVNIGAEELAQGVPHLVLGLMWQIIRIGLLAKVNIKSCPGLTRLLEGDETLADLLALPPDQLLVRWVNYHMKEAGSSRRITGFGKDISDSEVYTILLAQIAPKELGIDDSALKIADLNERAEKVLDNAHKMKCRRFVRAKDIVKGNAKLNLAFVANLFNEYPGLLPEEDFEGLGDLEDTEGTREERTFMNWMNSLGVSPFVHNLYNDLQDGLVLLDLFDKIDPGCVEQSRVVRKFKNIGLASKLQKVGNCNYAMELGTAHKFSLVGIEGNDINEGIKTLTLGVVWQMMRAYTIAVLQRLSGDSKRITDPAIVKFANNLVETAGKSSKIKNFKDSVISNSMPVLDMIEAIKPGTVDYEHVVVDSDDKEALMENARYAISCGRKIGAGIYCLPEDLVEVAPKMVMTCYAALMARALAIRPEK